MCKKTKETERISNNDIYIATFIICIADFMTIQWKTSLLQYLIFSTFHSGLCFPAIHNSSNEGGPCKVQRSSHEYIENSFKNNIPQI